MPVKQLDAIINTASLLHLQGCNFTGNAAKAAASSSAACGRDGAGGGGALCAVLQSHVFLLGCSLSNNTATNGGKLAAIQFMYHNPLCSGRYRLQSGIQCIRPATIPTHAPHSLTVGKQCPMQRAISDQCITVTFIQTNQACPCPIPHPGRGHPSWPLAAV